MTSVLTSISCPVCTAENNYLHAVCSSCGAFMQDRVPKIDLFESIYRIFEDPAKIFLKVARSEQKNYVYTLFAFAGYAIVSIIFMIGHVGNLQSNFIFTFAVFVLLGLPTGILFFTLVSFLAWLCNKYIWRLNIPYRISNAFVGYALIPVVLSVFIILPLELAIFGNILFSNNPSPQFYKPVVYYTLISFDVIAFVWTIFLFIKSFRSVYSISIIKICITALICIAFISFGSYLAGSLVHSII